MTPEFVAEGFMKLIKECANGTALLVVKDMPFVPVSDNSVASLAVLAMAGKIFQKMTGGDIFNFRHQVVALVIVLILHLIATAVSYIVTMDIRSIPARSVQSIVFGAIFP